ncbi:MAG: 5-aminolevulinate synthase [Alphaproteobacteria bacterium]|nr:5-aminolevulinate synthase [Alphaproteobacteria bacterium]
MDYTAFFKKNLDTLKSEGRYRHFANIERRAGDFPKADLHTPDGKKEIIIWCGNDYLGMGQHPKVVAATTKTIAQCGAGAGGTRNISGTTRYHVELEKELADLHNKEAGLVFTSGYVANEATLSTLGSLLPNCIIYSDSENHASMIQGIRHSKAQKRIFKHNDVEDLRRLLAQDDSSCAKLIVFESVYSMDGDIAPVKEICEAAKEFGALTYIDEVHGVGMYGQKGGGIAQARGLEDEVDIIQGTLGKAFGLIGGYITGSKELVDFVRSFASGFIFTTSITPSVAAGCIASIRHLKTSDQERLSHQNNARILKEKFLAVGIPYLKSESHIVPVIIGNAETCKQVTDALLHDYQIYVQPINYPTVPIGTERLRLTPSAIHTEEMAEQLVTALVEIWKRLGLSFVNGSFEDTEAA